MPEATRTTVQTHTLSSSAAPLHISGRPAPSSSAASPIPARMPETAREICQAKRVMNASYLAVSAPRLSSTLPRRSVSRFTAYKSQMRSSVSISGKLWLPSHLLTDWRETSSSSASCSWVTPACARRNCRFWENDIG